MHSLGAIGFLLSLSFSAVLAQDNGPLKYHIDFACKLAWKDGGDAGIPSDQIYGAIEIAKRSNSRLSKTQATEEEAFRDLGVLFGLNSPIEGSDAHKTARDYFGRIGGLVETDNIQEADVRIHCDENHIADRPDPPDLQPDESRNKDLPDGSRILIDTSNGIVLYGRKSDHCSLGMAAYTYWAQPGMGVELHVDETYPSGNPFPHIIDYGKWSAHKHDRSVIVLCPTGMKKLIPSFKYLIDKKAVETFLLDPQTMPEKPKRGIDSLNNMQTLVILHEFFHIKPIGLEDVPVKEGDWNTAYGWDNIIAHSTSNAMKNPDNYAFLGGLIRMQDNDVNLGISTNNPDSGRIIKLGSEAPVKRTPVTGRRGLKYV